MVASLLLSMIACNGPAEPATPATTGQIASIPEYHTPPPLDVEIWPRVMNLLPNQVEKATVNVSSASASCMATQLDISTSQAINATLEQTPLIPPNGATTLDVSIAPGAQVLGGVVVTVSASCVNLPQHGGTALQLCVPMTPATCPTDGSCGQMNDHCGGTVNCGCNMGQACISNQCQDYPCTTASCCRADGGRWINGQCVYNT
jgi:hypothetical protein